MNILTYPILACATCMSSRGEATTEAAGMAILLMLIILAGVFGGVFKFMRYLSRCERKAVGRR
ncbi:MAG: hypothetical protein NZ961_14920 [Candidatus Poribacteria bacterium]|jgi:hypothetical protein|nr:hypothetical protein [Candidatus Poribacteria bacterium]|tara:strand:- start:219 stop:407 length:189 start_codon:yes stop_codon:yes gene_type:complete